MAFSQQDGACSDTANGILGILHGMFDSHLKQLSQCFGCICSGHHVHQTLIPVSISFWATLKFVCTTPTPTLLRSWKQKLKLLPRRPQVTCCMTVDNVVVHLQWVHKVEGSHTEHMFTCTQTAHGSFLSCIMLLSKYLYMKTLACFPEYPVHNAGYKCCIVIHWC